MSIKPKICGLLTELIDTIKGVEALVNSHVGDFIVKNLWHGTIPADICNELDDTEISNFLLNYTQSLAQNDFTRFPPNTANVLYTSHQKSLLFNATCTTTLEALRNILLNNGITSSPEPIISAFMSDKKKHEVIRMAPLAGQISELTGVDCVIDIGGGKGYLSSVLASHNSLKVIGVDSSLSTTTGAAKLEKKMCRVNRRTENLCQRDTVLISRSSDLSSIVKNAFGPSCTSSGIVGLHTCGDLATSSLHLFLKNDVRWLINVGCCYHLISEEFDNSPFWDDCNANNSDYGFPVSQFLKLKKVRIGRNARMLSAHCVERIACNGISEASSLSLFYRALLQVLLVRIQGHNLIEGNVGKLASKCSSFHQYIHKAMQKLNIDANLTDADIDNLMSTYSTEEPKLKAFFLLRTHFAPVIESVILLDRLLFLLEQGIEHAYLVPLFDPVLSPRRFAIVAWKNT